MPILQQIHVLFDANVLLNGTLVPQSFSAAVLGDVQSGRIAAYVLENTLVEAVGAIQRAYNNTGVDLSSNFKNALKSIEYTLIPALDEKEGDQFSKIQGKADRLIAAAAHQLGLTVCTNDISDFQHAGTSYGINVISPSFLLERIYGDAAATARMFPGMFASPTEGTYIFQFWPNWGGQKFTADSRARFMFIDAPGIGSFYYRARNHSIVFRHDLGPSIEMEVGALPQNANTQVALAFRNTEGLALYYGYRGRNKKVSVSWPATTLPHGAKTSLGNSRIQSEQLNGAVSLCCGLPYRLSEKAINSIFAGSVLPENIERFSLEQIIEMHGLSQNETRYLPTGDRTLLLC